MASRSETTGKRRLTAEQALRAIVARMDGEFDNADLRRYGPLCGTWEDDVRGIVACGLTGKSRAELARAALSLPAPRWRR